MKQFITISLLALSLSLSAQSKPYILKADNYKHYVDYFNRMEDENIVQAIPNAQSWDWMKANIPFFECPQDNFEEMYYYRWWTYRKHIKETPQGFAITEFLVNRTYADKYNMIACAMGHHISEGRWLHNQQYLDNDVNLWYTGNEGKPMKKLHGFSNWAPWALYQRYLVTGDSAWLHRIYPSLTADYAEWERLNRLPSGLFWQSDVKDGMEETISGGRRVKYARPSINSYMYGNAVALSKMAELFGNADQQKLYAAKADTIRQLVMTKLWDADRQFFETMKEDGTHALVREAIGFIPWYFNLPLDGTEAAWKETKDEQGFLAPYGLTTAERRHPEFRTHGCCKCEWDGAIWPFATSQTLTAMANVIRNYNQNVVGDSVFFRHMELFVESQYHRGRPYIGEYLDETTGTWLKGDQERSRYYNHSTFNDLVITGLVGLVPRADNMVEVNPLIPQGKWAWFCLDNVMYKGKKLTILYDDSGKKYKKGKGLMLFVNGKKVAQSNKLQKIEARLN
jgi:hypothetical protein